MSALSWLENDLFLTAHTPSNFDSETTPATTYSIITRKDNVHQAQRLPEVCSPFGLNRLPPTQIFQRLRDYPPNLRDILIVSSTVSEDIGLFTRSKVPLSADYPAEQIVDKFTSTMITLDNRRATMPMTEDYQTASPIGMALDLSSTDAVEAPIPGDEIQSSDMPLPGLMALNNDGALSVWWIVYREAIKQKVAYPSLVNATATTTQPQTSTMGTPAPPSTSMFGQSQSSAPNATFGTTFGGSAKPTFGSSTPAGSSGSALGTSNALSGTFGAPAALGNTNSAFGASSVMGSTGGAFGATSGLGNKASPWGAQTSSQQPSSSTFSSTTNNQPVFGSSNALGTTPSGPSFGSSGGLGNRQSVWGSSAAATSTPTATFGTPGGNASSGSLFGNSTPAAPFGSTAKLSSPPNAGGFASFANSGGFLSAAAQNKGEDVLGKTSSAISFDSNMDTSSSFGAATPKKFGESAFGAATPMSGTATPQQTSGSGGLFGLGGGFKLGSTFKGDGTAKNDTSKPYLDNTSSLFGIDFGKSMDTVQTPGQVPESSEADMLSDTSDKGDNPATPDTPEKTPARSTTTPADTPAPSKFLAPTAPPATGGLFGTQAQTKTTPAAVQTSTPTALSSDQPASDINKAQIDVEKPIKLERQPSQDQTSPLQNIPEAPLPPEPRSKENYNSGDSSGSSIGDASNPPDGEPPLPPDFVYPKSGSHDVPKTVDEGTSPEGSPPSKEPSHVDSRSPEDQGPPADGSESGFDSGEVSESDQGLDDEGSGIDVARELTPPPEAVKTLQTTQAQKIRDPPRLFDSPKFPTAQSGKSLFGEIGSPPVLAPSRLKDQELPRSPSPTRPSKGLETLRVEARPESSRSVSESVLQSSRAEKMNLGLSRTIVPHQIRKTVEELQAEELRREEQRQAKRAAEEQALEDEDDLRIRQELEAPIEPTLMLAPFLSHQDYVGHIDKEGIPWQIESLYRDMNSMVDLLGLNARSLQAFILGHDKEIEEPQPDSDVLDSDREWCLNDVSLLADLEDSLDNRRQGFSLDQLQAKLLKCTELQKELSTLKKTRLQVQHTVELRKDPAHLEALRTAALPADQAALQNDLRKSFIATQKLLADAEEQIVLLRAKLAVRGANSGSKPGFGAQKAPTIEAIQNTITKMTGMVERKSGDIDMLEMQVRKLRELDLNDRSRQGTPVGTPSRKAIGTPGSNGFFTPRSSRLGASGGSLGATPGRTEMDVMLEEDARRYEEKVRRRKEINGLVKTALIKNGMRVRTLDAV